MTSGRKMEWLSDKRSSPLEHAVSPPVHGSGAAAAERGFPAIAPRFTSGKPGERGRGERRCWERRSGPGRCRRGVSARPCPPALRRTAPRCRRSDPPAPGRAAGLPRSRPSPKHGSPFAPANREGERGGSPRAFQLRAVIDAEEQPLTINSSLPVD